MALIRTFRRASSTASGRTAAVMAPFAAEYAAPPAAPWRAAAELSQMIEHPSSAARRLETIALVREIFVTTRDVSILSSDLLSVIGSWPSQWIPAQSTTPRSGPTSALIRWASWTTSSSEVRSHGTVTCAAVGSAARVSSKRHRSRATRTTRAPSEANRTAVARPMPEDDPVTKQAQSGKRFMSVHPPVRRGPGRSTATRSATGSHLRPRVGQFDPGTFVESYYQRMDRHRVKGVDRKKVCVRPELGGLDLQNLVDDLTQLGRRHARTPLATT